MLCGFVPRLFPYAIAPGPGEYHVPSRPATAGVAFSTFNPKSDLELKIDRARNEPVS